MYARPFYRVSFLFDITGTDERAVTTLALAPASGSATMPPPTTDDADALGAAFEDFLTSIGGYRANYSRYIGVKVAALDVNGEYTSEPAESAPATPVVGGTGNIAPQSTIVISLRSGESLGKGNYGRMYLPHSGKPGTSGPYLESGVPLAVATEAADFIGAVNDLTVGSLSGLTVRIMSEAGSPPPSKAVTSVAVGRVIDTQRRRRNALTEEYQFVAVS